MKTTDSENTRVCDRPVLLVAGRSHRLDGGQRHPLERARGSERVGQLGGAGADGVAQSSEKLGLGTAARVELAVRAVCPDQGPSSCCHCFRTPESP